VQFFFDSHGSLKCTDYGDITEKICSLQSQSDKHVKSVDVKTAITQTAMLTRCTGQFYHVASYTQCSITKGPLAFNGRT